MAPYGRCILSSLCALDCTHSTKLYYDTCIQNDILKAHKGKKHSNCEVSISILQHLYMNVRVCLGCQILKLCLVLQGPAHAHYGLQAHM